MRIAFTGRIDTCKHWLFALLGLWLCMDIAWAAPQQDSLEVKLLQAGSPQEKVDALLQLSESYMLESSSEVRRYALRALALSDSLEYEQGRVKSLANLTWAARIAGDYAQAILYAEQCLEAAEKSDNKAGMAAAFYEMAAVYQGQKNYPQAREMFRMALPQFVALQDTYGIGKCFNGVGESFRWEMNWDSALTNYGEAERYFQAIHHRKGMILIKNNRGLVYSGQKQFQKALDTLLYSNAKAEEEKFTAVVLESSVEIAKIWMELGDPEKAIAQAEEALKLADSLQLPRHVFDAAEALYGFALTRKDFESALRYQELMHKSESQMRSDEVTFRLSSLDFDLKMREKENEILGLQKDQRIKSLWQTLMGLMLALSAITFSLLAYAFNKNRKNTRLLARQNVVLAELNREQDSLMHIVAHDLKSPMAKVKALTAMISISGDLSDRQKTALGMIEKVVVDGEHLIQNLLDIRLAESETAQLNIESGDLCVWIQEWMGQHEESAAKKKIKLHYTCHTQNIPIQTERSYLSRIFDNILSNAIKYTPFDREVGVEISADAEWMYISVTDQGPGISKEDQEIMFRKFQRLTARPTGGESSTGLGLSIIKTLVQRLNGEITLESTLGEGSTFKVSLPLVHKTS